MLITDMLKIFHEVVCDFNHNFLWTLFTPIYRISIPGVVGISYIATFISRFLLAFLDFIGTGFSEEPDRTVVSE